jgi:hypothetical protein
MAVLIDLGARWQRKAAREKLSKKDAPNVSIGLENQ